MDKKLIMFACFTLWFSSFLEAQIHRAGYIDVDNARIYYDSAGTGRTIVFIHDGILPGKVWDEQFTHLTDKYHLVRYDRRGYGKSSPARGDYSNLEDLHTLFEKLGIDQACLAGMSSGGALAIDFTLKYPEKVNSLVLVGAVVGGFSYTSFMRSRGGHLPKSFANDTEKYTYYILEDPYIIWKDNKEAKMKALNIVKNFPKRIIDRPRFARPEVLPFERLDEIKAPTLILTGEHDIPDVHACSGLFDGCIPDSRRFVIPGCGHLVPLEQPELFNEIVSGFLDGSNK